MNTKMNEKTTTKTSFYSPTRGCSPVGSQDGKKEVLSNGNSDCKKFEKVAKRNQNNISNAYCQEVFTDVQDNLNLLTSFYKRYESESNRRKKNIVYLHDSCSFTFQEIGQVYKITTQFAQNIYKRAKSKRGGELHD